jgi:hypothetical protein
LLLLNSTLPVEGYSWEIENEKVVLKPQPSADESYDDLLSKMFAKSHIKQ